MTPANRTHPPGVEEMRGHGKEGQKEGGRGGGGGKGGREILIHAHVCGYDQHHHDAQHTRKLVPSFSPHFLLGHSVVANEGVGEGEDLAAVGRVGQRLHIAHHACLEHWGEGEEGGEEEEEEEEEEEKDF